MSFLKKLFGGGGSGGGDKTAAPPVVMAEELYRDLLIQATPVAEKGQFRLAGTVSHGTGDAKREHRFVRADMFQTADEAAHAALRKGRQLIDEQGEGLFGG